MGTAHLVEAAVREGLCYLLWEEPLTSHHYLFSTWAQTMTSYNFYLTTARLQVTWSWWQGSYQHLETQNPRPVSLMTCFMATIWLNTQLGVCTERLLHPNLLFIQLWVKSFICMIPLSSPRMSLAAEPEVPWGAWDKLRFLSRERWFLAGAQGRTISG